MSDIATELERIQNAKNAIKNAIIAKGVEVDDEKIDEYADKIASIVVSDVDPQTRDYNPLTATAKTIGGVSVSTSPYVKIYGSDKKSYTCEEWYALETKPTPIGFDIEACHEHFVIYFYNFTQNGKYTYYDVTGSTAQTDGQLGYSQYGCPMFNSVTTTGSWTDVDNTTAKATADGDNIILTTSKFEGKQWSIAKNCGYRYVFADAIDNSLDRTEAMYAISEWLRWRGAIYSGLTTTDADGTEGTITIVNASGSTPAVNEDMYFAINGTITSKLAKYNRHTASGSLTQTIADAIYTKQLANGVNMNDAGVNSASKPILTLGAKGAEAIAWNGKWWIITPILTSCADSTSLDKNIPDAPAVYYVKKVLQPLYGDDVMLPSERMLEAYYLNRSTLLDSMRTFLNSTAGGSCNINSTLSEYVWCAPRSSATGACYVYIGKGCISIGNVYSRFAVVGASALS